MPTAAQQGSDLPSGVALDAADPWNPLTVDQATAPPRPGYGPHDGENPYSPVATAPGERSVPPQRSTGYVVPGVLLVAFSAIGLFTYGLYLIGLLIGGLLAGPPLEVIIMMAFFTLAALSHGASFVGGMQMIRRGRLDLARLGAWAALYPCGFCAGLQIPLAIWALVILHSDSAPADFASSAKQVSKVG